MPRAIWLIDLRHAASSGANAVDVIVGGRSSQSTSYTGELHLTRDNFTDEQIGELAVDLMKRIVRGELPPGVREFL